MRDEEQGPDLGKRQVLRQPAREAGSRSVERMGHVRDDRSEEIG